MYYLLKNPLITQKNNGEKYVILIVMKRYLGYNIPFARNRLQNRNIYEG